MINRIVLVGRLTKDPELKYTPNGVPVATFTLAVTRAMPNQQGEREADFINCVVWRKPAENVANFLKKGSLAGVDGRLQIRSYDGQDGKRQYWTEVIADSVQFLEPRNASGDRSEGGMYNNPPREQSGPYGGGNSYQNQPQRQPQNQGFGGGRIDEDPFRNNSGQIDISDDDLPF